MYVFQLSMLLTFSHHSHPGSGGVNFRSVLLSVIFFNLVKSEIPIKMKYQKTEMNNRDIK